MRNQTGLEALFDQLMMTIQAQEQEIERLKQQAEPDPAPNGDQPKAKEPVKERSA